MRVNIDADPMNADWTKRTWDAGLPRNPRALRRWLKRQGITPEQFRRSPLYRYNVKRMPWIEEALRGAEHSSLQVAFGKLRR